MGQRGVGGGRIGRALVLVSTAAFGAAGARGQTVVRADDDRYEATVVGFQTGLDSAGIRHGWLALRFHNVSKEPLCLGADPTGDTATDEADARYKGGFFGALGIACTGTVDARFTLPPGGTAEALVYLSGLTQSNTTVGKTFGVTLAIADVKPDAEGKPVVGRKRALRITGLTTAEFAPKDDAGVEPPQAVADPFFARVTRAMVAPSGDQAGEALVMTIAVTNRLKTPLRLEYTSIFAVDEQGHGYRRDGLAAGSAYDLRGFPDLSAYDADLRFLLPPGTTRSFTFPMTNGGAIPDGKRFGVYLGLSTLAPDAEGKYHADQDYRLSFFYVRPTARSATPLGGG